MKNKPTTIDDEPEKAFKACIAAAAEGKTELARIYILNAITHKPAVRYLDEYVRLLASDDNDGWEDAFSQAYNILSMAALNGAVDDIDHIQTLIAKLQRVEAGRQTPPAANGGEGKPMGTELWMEIAKRYSWKLYRKSGDLFSTDKLQEKEAVLRQALESGVLDEVQTAAAIKEIRETQWQAGYLEARQAFENVIDATRQELEKERPIAPRVGALMSQAAIALNQLWVLDAKGPLGEKELLAEQQREQDRFSALEPEAQCVLSEKYCSAISAVENRYVDNPKKTFTRRMEVHQQKIAKLQEILSHIPHEKTRDDLAARIKVLTEELAEFARKRFAAYQKMAADRALQAIRQFDDTTLVTKKDAETILSDCRLAEIDESLLSPEASAIFQSAKSMLAAKFNTVQRAEYEHKCVMTRKCRLEQF